MRISYFFLSVVLAVTAQAKPCATWLALMNPVIQRMEVLSTERAHTLLAHPVYGISMREIMRAYVGIEKLPDEFLLDLQATGVSGVQPDKEGKYEERAAHALSVLKQVEARFPHVKLHPQVRSVLESYLRSLYTTTASRESSRNYFMDLAKSFRMHMGDKDFAAVHSALRKAAETAANNRLLGPGQRGANLSKIPGHPLSFTGKQFHQILQRTRPRTPVLNRHLDTLFVFFVNQGLRGLMASEAEKLNQMIDSRQLTREAFTKMMERLIAEDPILVDLKPLAMRLANHLLGGLIGRTDEITGIRRRLKEAITAAMAEVDQRLRKEEKAEADRRATEMPSIPGRPTIQLSRSGPQANRPVRNRVRASAPSSASLAEPSVRYPSLEEVKLLSDDQLITGLAAYGPGEFYEKKVRNGIEEMEAAYTKDEFRVFLQKTFHALNLLAQGRQPHTIPEMVRASTGEKVAEFRPLGKKPTMRVFIGLDGQKHPVTGVPQPAVLRIVLNIKGGEMQQRLIVGLSEEWRIYRGAR